MNNESTLIFLAIGILLGLLEIYLVKKKKINRMILPVIVWVISIAIAIPFSVPFGAILALFQAVALVGLYIEDKINYKNNDKEKIKIKDL